MKHIKKLMLLGIISLTTSQITFSQISFSHSVGASYYVGGGAGAPALMYSPRLNFMELSDEITISVGTHLGLGMVINSREGASSFALDLPIVVEINFGHGANPDTQSSFGGFGGLGLGISKIGSAGTFDSDYNNAAGIVINGGIRAIIKERAMGLRISYLLNIKADAESVIGVGIFYTFGDF